MHARMLQLPFKSVLLPGFEQSCLFPDAHSCRFVYLRTSIQRLILVARASAAFGWTCRCVDTVLPRKVQVYDMPTRE